VRTYMGGQLSNGTAIGGRETLSGALDWAPSSPISGGFSFQEQAIGPL